MVDEDEFIIQHYNFTAFVMLTRAMYGGIALNMG